MHTQKTGSDLQLNASHPVFQFEAWFFTGLFFIGDWLRILQTENFNPAVFQQLLKEQRCPESKNWFAKDRASF